MSITLEHIVAKVRASRPIYNMRGERIELNNQERSVLVYMCAYGMRHKQIAHELGQPERVIREISAATLRNSGCKTHAQLGAWAVKQGLV